MATANHTVAEWDRKMKELKRKKMLQKKQAWERGEGTDSDDDDDDDDKEYDEVVADVEWDVLEGEDLLIGTHLSSQGPFLFYAGESESVRTAEMGQTIGLSLGLVGAGGSTAMLGVSVEGGSSAVAPHELMGGEWLHCHAP